MTASFKITKQSAKKTNETVIREELKKTFYVKKVNLQTRAELLHEQILNRR